MSIPVTN